MVTCFTDFPNKEEVSAVLTTRVVDKNKFLSPSRKPNEDGCVPNYLLMVEPDDQL
jgi:hypothetical protein